MGWQPGWVVRTHPEGATCVVGGGLFYCVFCLALVCLALLCLHRRGVSRARVRRSNRAATAPPSANRSHASIPRIGSSLTQARIDGSGLNPSHTIVESNTGGSTARLGTAENPTFPTDQIHETETQRTHRNPRPSQTRRGSDALLKKKKKTYLVKHLHLLHAQHAHVELPEHRRHRCHRVSHPTVLQGLPPGLQGRR